MLEYLYELIYSCVTYKKWWVFWVIWWHFLWILIFQTWLMKTSDHHDLAHIHCYTLPPWPPPAHTSQQNTPDHHQRPSRQPPYAADRKLASLSLPHERTWEKWDLRLGISRYHDLADAVVDGVAILAFDPDVALIAHAHEGPHVTFIFLGMTHGAPRDLMRLASHAEPWGADILISWPGRSVAKHEIWGVFLFWILLCSSVTFGKGVASSYILFSQVEEGVHALRQPQQLLCRVFEHEVFHGEALRREETFVLGNSRGIRFTCRWLSSYFS